jgi:hypothetical protein
LLDDDQVEAKLVRARHALMQNAQLVFSHRTEALPAVKRAERKPKKRRSDRGALDR